MAQSVDASTFFHHTLSSSSLPLWGEMALARQKQWPSLDPAVAALEAWVIESKAFRLSLPEMQSIASFPLLRRQAKQQLQSAQPSYESWAEWKTLLGSHPIEHQDWLSSCRLGGPVTWGYELALQAEHVRRLLSSSSPSVKSCVDFFGMDADIHHFSIAEKVPVSFKKIHAESLALLYAWQFPFRYYLQHKAESFFNENVEIHDEDESFDEENLFSTLAHALPWSLFENIWKCQDPVQDASWESLLKQCRSGLDCTQSVSSEHFRHFPMPESLSTTMETLSKKDPQAFMRLFAWWSVMVPDHEPSWVLMQRQAWRTTVVAASAPSISRARL